MNAVFALTLGLSLVLGQRPSEKYEGQGFWAPTMRELTDCQSWMGECKLTSVRAEKGAEAVDLPNGMRCDPLEYREKLPPQAMAPFPMRATLAYRNQTQGTMTLEATIEGEKEQAAPVTFDFDYDPKTGRMTTDLFVAPRSTAGEWRLTLDATATTRVRGELKKIKNRDSGRTPAPKSGAEKVVYVGNYVFSGKLTARAGEGDKRVRIDFLIRMRSEEMEIESIVDRALQTVEGTSGVGIRGFTGPVDVRSGSDEGDWKGAGLKSIVKVGDHIRTGIDEGNDAEISIDDVATINMGSLTEIVIAAVSEEGNRIELVDGAIRTDASSMDKDRRVEVQMPQGSAAIDRKGCAFVCEATSDGSTVKVLKGQVTVTSKADGKVKKLKAGETITVTTEGYGLKMQFDKDQESAKWDLPFKA